MELIERPLYLNRLKSVIGTPDIKVITGVRRSGKSKLMDAFYQYLTQEDPSRNVIRIKLNLKENEALLDAEHLYQYVESAYVSGRENTLLIDEVQLCAGFEKIINSFYEEEKFDIYLTGSNAFLQSSDLATLFGGRVFEIAMYPFSFREYLDSQKYKELRNNGIPGTINIHALSGCRPMISEKRRKTEKKSVTLRLEAG